jgi:hypothetical protein
MIVCAGIEVYCNMLIMYFVDTILSIQDYMCVCVCVCVLCVVSVCVCVWVCLFELFEFCSFIMMI